VETTFIASTSVFGMNKMNGSDILRMNYTTITCPQGHEKSIRTDLYKAMKFVGSDVRCSKCIELFEIK